MRVESGIDLSSKPTGPLQSLWLVAGVNLVLAAITADQRLDKPFGVSLNPIINGGLRSQLVLLGVVAALYPRRAVFGAMIAAGIALLRGLATYTTGSQIIGFIGLDEGLRTLPVVTTLQGLRLVTGWRIAKGQCSDHRPGQFELVELLDWITTIGIAMGFWAYFRSQLPQEVLNRSLVIDYLLELVPLPLISVPVVLAILAEKRPSKSTMLALVLWCLLITVGLFFADLRHRISIRLLLALFARNGVPYLATFMAVTVFNACWLRWLGYRWCRTS
jgi:hypothetical protein